MRVIGYVRVSSAEQAASGLGLDAQRHAISDECRRRGWDLIDVLEDAAISGKAIENRPGLLDALDRVEGRGRTADGIVVAKLDRLTRSLKDFAVLLERAKEKRWNLVAIDLNIDLSTPAGEFLASVMAAAAAWERALISQRTKDALDAKRRSGVRLGRPRAATEDLVAELRRLRASGLSYAAIAEAVNRSPLSPLHGGSTWHANTVRRIILAN